MVIISFRRKEVDFRIKGNLPPPVGEKNPYHSVLWRFIKESLISKRKNNFMFEKGKKRLFEMKSSLFCLVIN